MISSTQMKTFASRGGKKRALLDFRLADLLWIVGFNLLLFEDVIQEVTGFSYIDELMTLFFFGNAIKTATTMQRVGVMNSRAFASVLFLLMTVCLGLLGNMMWGLQTNVAPIAIDIFTCIKFTIATVSCCVIFNRSTEALFEAIEAEAKLFAIVFLVLGAANLFVDFGMGGESRYGLRASFVGVFSRPTYLVFACAGLSMILLVNWRKNLLWIFMTLLVASLSLRTKGLVFAALVLVLILLYARSGRLTFPHVVVCVALALLIGYDQFVSYFGTDGYARSELLRTSFAVASDYAPFGSGFATYGSAITAEPAYYSSLYYQYGLSTVHGLTLGNASFLSDTFWPIVLGQFGWLGLACYVGMLMSLFFYTLQLNGAAKLATICGWLYLLISSTSESAFFNPMAIFIAMCIALVVSRQIDRPAKSSDRQSKAIRSIAR